jgi:2-polyprenyl-6-hydroxyphenyl methylase/3-demethylubiquinone-9 3-methyltransferase
MASREVFDVSTCTICGAPSVPAGVADLNKSGNDFFEGRAMFPVAGVEVPYHRCVACGFLFTDFFARWEPAEFSHRIYNDEYLLLAHALGEDHRELDILDYGGGVGALERKLHARGFVNVHTFDPHHPASSVVPERPVALVTAFEVLEHVWDQHALANQVSSLVAPEGCFVFSTLLQPTEIEQANASWWYACPRNAHMSLHTARSLECLFADVGFRLHSLSDELHVAFATPSPLVERFLAQRPTLRVNE